MTQACKARKSAALQLALSKLLCVYYNISKENLQGFSSISSGAELDDLNIAKRGQYIIEETGYVGISD